MFAIMFTGMFAAPRAKGADVAATSASAAASGWSTATHLGFGITDQSSTGFRAVGGSVGFLDVQRALGQDFAVGLRTTGEGGRLPAEQFYRLGAGPLMTWKADDAWRFQAALALFDESGMRPDGARVYRSRGGMGMVGCERTTELAPRVSASWGAFLSKHQGTLTQEGTGPAPVAPAATTNSGISHGLEVSLEIQL
jgi:hypothetical protein